MKIFDPLPHFTCVDLSGEPFSINDLSSSSVVVVCFLSATCPYVLAIEPRLLALARATEPLGVRFVAVCSSTDPGMSQGNSYEDIRAHAAAMEYPFPYLYDAEQSVAKALGATLTPEMFVFDEERLLRYHGAFDDCWLDEKAVRRSYLAEAISRLLAGESPDEGPAPFGCTIKLTSAPTDFFDEPLVLSPYVRVLQHPFELRLVQSRRGSLIEASEDVLDFLSSFREPATVRSLTKRLPLPEGAAEFAGQLVDLGFLASPEEDPDTELRRSAGDRARRASTGALLSILRLNLTSGCNLRCTYCYLESVNREKDRNTALMSADVALAAVDRFVANAVRNGRRRVTIRYIGGEPLLNREVLEQTMDHAEIETNSRGIQCTHLLCTNGVLLDSALVRRMLSLREAHVLVSLDGIREDSDRLRFHLDGRGAWNEVISAIRLLVAEGLPFGVPCVVNACNYNNLERFIEEMAALGVTRIGLNPEYDLGYEAFDADSLPALVDVLFRCRERAAELGIQLSGKAFLLEWHALEGHLANCEAMGRAVMVDPDGSLSVCDKIQGALAKDLDFDAFLKHPLYLSFAGRVRGSIPACSECEIRLLCNGGCAAEVLRRYGNLAKPSLQCELYRAMAARLFVEVHGRRAAC